MEKEKAMRTHKGAGYTLHEEVRKPTPALLRASQIGVLSYDEPSLAAQEYYAHPANRFWPLITKLLKENETPVDYDARLKMLLRHHVALWDAIDTCDRTGSLDSDIRNAKANDFTTFLRRWPQIRTIGLNGGKAYATFAKANRSLLDRADLRILKLPSTSPANARWRMDDLLIAWSALFA